MARTADQIQFSTELMRRYQVSQSYLRGCVTTEGNLSGKSYTWTLGSRVVKASKRGANGNIVYGVTDTDQLSVEVEEFPVGIKNTNFMAGTSPTDVKMQMQEDIVASLNEKTDDIIRAALATTTNAPAFASGVLTLNKILEAQAFMSQNFVATAAKDEMWWLLTPKAWNRLLLIPQFTSADYVSELAFMKGTPIKKMGKTYFCEVPNLDGVGSATASCYLIDKKAVGHASVLNETLMASGYNDEHHYHYSNGITYQAARILQPLGVMKFTHDDSIAL